MSMRKVVLGATLALGLGVAGVASAQQRVQIEFWHGLTPPPGQLLEQIVAEFNASQTAYQVNAAFKGSYPETMTAAIAAFRAGTAPHIVQMFEVGTGTMMAAGRAVKPLHELIAETGVQIDINDYVPAVRGYYALPLLWRDQIIGWGNLAVRDGVLDADLGYVAGRPPRDAAFRHACEAELGAIGRFLGL